MNIARIKISNKIEIPLNIPNLLSLYRILVSPFILMMVFFDFELLFAWFISISLITDILDGFIARRFNMQTEIGARLDSIADIGTYLLGFAGIFTFKFSDFGAHIYFLYVFMGFFALTQIFSLIKFKQTSKFHLYSWKIAGYIQGFFFFTLFVFGFNAVFFHLAIWMGYLAFAEHLIIQLVISEMKSNLKGLFWVLKK
ncbi:MAG: CDP-alcohol phosphatidyltransferase family protein [Bacteroidales bacterium]|nr:CDP-alcohol phosphatidyltransferase family protein [Bacteroidales bacterium]